MRSFIIKPGDLIPIGRAGENQATQIRFDVTGWADTFGAGTYTLVVKRPHEDTAYPVEVTVDGDYVVWTVSNVDTGIAGNASVQLRYVVDGALAKSVIYTGIVGESLDNIVDPPDPFEDLIQRMVDLAERTEAAAESAAGSAAAASESAGTAAAAKTAAQTAAQAAQAAQATATQAAQTATQAKDAAQAAKQAAEAAQSAAAQSATAASGSATAAAGSAAQAAASATAADASAAAAAQSAAAAQAAAQNVIDKAPIITDTASGAIASFPDGTDAPIKQLTVNIEPQQDLHGYDNPWPAGGGKNKLPLKFYSGVGYNVNAGTVFNTSTEYTDGTVSGNTVTFTVSGWGSRCMLSDRLISGESYYISMEVTSANLRFTWYTLDADLKTVRKYEVTGSGTSKTVRNPVTMSETECYIAIYLGSSVQGDISYTEPQIEVGNAKTDFAPYENLCPITGWTGANVEAAGRNLFDKTNVNVLNVGFTQSNPVIAANNINRTIYIACKPNTTYTLSKTAVASGGSDRFYAAWTDAVPAAGVTAHDIINTTASADGVREKLTITTGATAKYLACFVSRATEYDDTLPSVQIETGSNMTDYQAYAGTTYTITWQSEAGTVYGGHWIAHQDGSVTLVADMEYVDMGTLEWVYNTTWSNVPVFYAPKNDIKYTSSGEIPRMKCSQYKTVNANVLYLGENNACSSGSKAIRVRDNAYSDADTFTAAMNGVQMVYELATPVTYTLTAAEMTTLFGQNNWWADCGDIAEINYRCDTRKFIEKKLAALLAALS